MKRSLWLCRLLLACVIAAGCEVGHPLVDRIPLASPSIGVGQQCSPGLSCDEPTTFGNSLTQLRALNWTSCDGVCDPTLGDDAGDFDDSDVGLFGIDADANGALIEASQEVVGALWQDSRVLFAAEAPIEVVVSRSQITDSIVVLRGPVTLRLRDDTVVSGVSISSDSPFARVIIDGLRTEALTIGDASAAFAGTVETRHSVLTDASMNVEELDLESVVVEASMIQARHLESTDGIWSDVTFNVGDATFAASRIELSSVVSCGTLSFFGAFVDRTAIARCVGEPTRLYSTVMVAGSLDGVVHSDASQLSRVLLGRVEPSDLVLWATTVSSSMFCDHVQSVKLSPASVSCSDCTQHVFDVPEVACSLDVDRAPASSALPSNPCLALDALPDCPAPLPDRPRPVAGG